MKRKLGILEISYPQSGHFTYFAADFFIFKRVLPVLACLASAIPPLQYLQYAHVRDNIFGFPELNILVKLFARWVTVNLAGSSRVLVALHSKLFYLFIFLSYRYDSWCMAIVLHLPLLKRVVIFHVNYRPSLKIA